jgi:hypothetical protein
MLTDKSQRLSDPLMYLNIRCPVGSYDPNVEPAKDDVLFDHSLGLSVVAAIEELFDSIYRTVQAPPEPEPEPEPEPVQNKETVQEIGKLLALSPPSPHTPKFQHGFGIPPVFGLRSPPATLDFCGEIGPRLHRFQKYPLQDPENAGALDKFLIRTPKSPEQYQHRRLVPEEFTRAPIVSGYAYENTDEPEPGLEAEPEPRSSHPLQAQLHMGCLDGRSPVNEFITAAQVHRELEIEQPVRLAKKRRTIEKALVLEDKDDTNRQDLDERAGHQYPTHSPQIPRFQGSPPPPPPPPPEAIKHRRRKPRANLLPLEAPPSPQAVHTDSPRLLPLTFRRYAVFRWRLMR